VHNPWLDIPLGDYEAHMDLPTVGQARLIADQLQFLLRDRSPSSVAIVGCAGGNGFEELAAAGVSRTVGVDINPRYVEEARRRHGKKIAGLELYVADIENPAPLFDPVELVYAALVLEYVDVALAMKMLRAHCLADGGLAVLLQMPHETFSPVSSSPYASMQLLGPAMRLVSTAELSHHAQEAGFEAERSITVESTTGKRFSLETFRVGIR
jgi:SAM-dependent methyltransferase